MSARLSRLRLLTYPIVRAAGIGIAAGGVLAGTLLMWWLYGPAVALGGAEWMCFGR